MLVLLVLLRAPTLSTSRTTTRALPLSSSDRRSNGADSSIFRRSLLLHQGLIERAFLDEIEAVRLSLALSSPASPADPPPSLQRRAHLPVSAKSPAPHGGVFRPYEFDTCSTDESHEYPVETKFHHADTKEEFTVRSKYLLGVDGARSLVRRAISGGQPGDGEWQGKIKMLGDASDIIWGVMDVEVYVSFISSVTRVELIRLRPLSAARPTSLTSCPSA